MPLAVTMLVGLAAVIILGRRRQVVAGWCVGQVALTELLVVEWVRDRLDPPFLDFHLALLSLACLAASALLAGSWVLVERHASSPEIERSATRPTPALLYRTEEGTNP